MEHLLPALNFVKDQANWQTIAAIVTAATSVALGYLTWVLAKETRVLSRATSQAHVTVTFEPNLWAMHWVDIVVANSGNAVAYDIEVSFDPPLPRLSERSEANGVPLQHISILRPTQSIKSSLCENSRLTDRAYRVTIGWRPSPKAQKREALTYVLSLADYDDVSRLGAASPLVQIAEQMKKLREDWKSVAQGRHHIKADVYAKADRDAEAEQRRAWIEERAQRPAPETNDG
ncbi:hypothetical protein [Sinorhizobium terangae]|uniref:hypothetical protein n=1 Tax=Sinorhizobium terangae TaxID=110322 RepID=UPI0024B15E86|nr:hypothetical protein [Sinorhizobium terangae]WFU47724.1 hypothetical protein QA637_18050 [Sinorhizobium terangae]